MTWSWKHSAGWPKPRALLSGLAEYAVATKNVHFAKGTLLDYDGVCLAEGGWPAKAYQDAAEREAIRGPSMPLNYASKQAEIVGVGTYPQARVASPYSELDVQTLPAPSDSTPSQPTDTESLPAPQKSQNKPTPEKSKSSMMSLPTLSPSAGAAATVENPFVPTSFDEPVEAAESPDDRPTASPADDAPLNRLPPPSL